jgi:hypothetical protein
VKNTIASFTQKAIAEKKMSLYVGAMILVLAATMMHPGFASLLTITILAGMLVAFRWVVLMEAGLNKVPRAGELH